jgi:hypothetical protein
MNHVEKMTKKPKRYYNQYDRDSRNTSSRKKHMITYEMLFLLYVIFDIYFSLTVNYNIAIGVFVVCLLFFIVAITRLKPIYKRKIYKYANTFIKMYQNDTYTQY